MNGVIRGHWVISDLGYGMMEAKNERNDRGCRDNSMESPTNTMTKAMEQAMKEAMEQAIGVECKNWFVYAWM